MSDKGNVFVRFFKFIGLIFETIFFKYNIGLIFVAVITALAYAISQS